MPMVGETIASIKSYERRCAHGTSSDLSNTSSGPVYAAINSFLPSNDPNTSGKPKAYLNWGLLDDLSEMILKKAGDIRLLLL